MKKLFNTLTILVLLVVLAIGIVSANLVLITIENEGNPGAIWTTKDDCGSEQQNVNQYNIGEYVYIKGENFNLGEYDWNIKGLPGQASCDPSIIVASGTKTVNSDGSFCFNAYTVQNNDCGEYRVIFGSNKHDNYHVIPEFGIVVGILTLVSAVGIFFFVRRK
ncbi:MAG: hypothetical protein ABIH65_00105 [Nanoarchaeota archaeon]